MKRLFSILATAALATLALAPAARAEFALHDLDLAFTGADGSPSMQAGSHPFAFSFNFGVTTTVKEGIETPEEDVRDVLSQLPPGFIANPTAVPRCSAADFARGTGEAECPAASSLGVFDLVFGFGEPSLFKVPVFNLEPPPGAVVRLGFKPLGVPVTIDGGLRPTPPYNAYANSIGISQAAYFYSGRLTLWGNPAAPVHDEERGVCASSNAKDSCPANLSQTPFLVLPRSCGGPLEMKIRARSWPSPDNWLDYAIQTHDDSIPPQPLGTTGCGKLGLPASITAKPTSKAASSPTGLDFSLDVTDPGLTNPDGIANSDIRKAVVTLPEGFTTNPAVADGLSVCSEAQLAAETVGSAPGDGCPNAAKIGTVEVESPLIQESVDGSLFIAKPYENPFHSLLAMYMVIKNPQLGIIVKQPLKVETDPITGRITTTADDIPQLPFSHFRLHFREGTRSPLATPPACGTHAVEAVLTPWSGGAPVTTTSAFEIVSGPDGGPCPTGGVPSFRPGLQAGTLNNAAGRFSPFNVRLFRSDAEQEITHFSIKLPPGLVGKLAGIPYCPDAAIAAAKARTGPQGGAEEEANPSCPAASQIGRTLVGSGVGPSLAYAPGKVYLAGPYHGSPLSLAAITAARVGPFDLGTVVVREAFEINPETAEVFIDATGSDPIPHIIQGIPVHLRDIRVYTDRPEFVLNPTDCDRTSTASTVLGSGLDFGSEADDVPVTVSTPFQAADCAALPFDPRLKLQLLGGTKRGAYPKFRATLRMNGIGEAAISHAQVTLPHSQFLENAHIKTICTRAQFREGEGNGERCPAASIYGFARATTPILDQPLEGPVFLRSSEHPLPDLVASLRNGQIDIHLVGRIDSVKGQIRNTFDLVPDAPVSSFTLEMQGGGKGLLVNSTNLCRGKHRALVDFDAHNGKAKVFRPALQAKCPKGRKGKGAKARPRPAR